MSITLVWFRRDLRTFDHTALQTAIQRGLPVVGVYVFDTDILLKLPENDRRMSFIHDCVNELEQTLHQQDIPLWVLHGRAEIEIPALAAKFSAPTVICAEEYEPQAIKRDNDIWRVLDAAQRTFIRVTDQVLWSKAALMTPQGLPHTTFAPYKKAWLATLEQQPIWQADDDWQALAQLQTQLPESARQTPPLPTLEQLGFKRRHLLMFQGGENAAKSALVDFLPQLPFYHIERDLPAKKGTSALAPHIRFGTLSIRHLINLTQQENNQGAKVWLDELIWREFWQQFLYHHPNVADESFRPEYRHLKWSNNHNWFERWKAGQTGYPIIDAAMRQLAKSGYLHTRLRIIAASFLVNNLLIDWRWGEAWFAEQLLDFELATNNGDWQWVAGTGGEVPLPSRIINPIMQSQKLDPDGAFIKRYLPELTHLNNEVIHAPWLAKSSVNTYNYPAPMVDHAVQREQALALFNPQPS
mgnify:FL=1